MVSLGLGECSDKMFVTNGNKCVSEFSNHQLISIKCNDKAFLDKWFTLFFSSGTSVDARLDEEFITSTFYTNDEFEESLGQEICIALDVALATSRYEVIVEGVVSDHKKSSGKPN